jgi:hypothetical protein
MTHLWSTQGVVASGSNWPRGEATHGELTTASITTPWLGIAVAV